MKGECNEGMKGTLDKQQKQGDNEEMEIIMEEWRQTIEETIIEAWKREERGKGGVEQRKGKEKRRDNKKCTLYIKYNPPPMSYSYSFPNLSCILFCYHTHMKRGESYKSSFPLFLFLKCHPMRI